MPRLWLLSVAGHAYNLQGCLVPVCSLVDAVVATIAAAITTGKDECLLRGTRTGRAGSQGRNGNVRGLVLCLYIGQTCLEEVDVVLGVDLPRSELAMASALSDL